MWWSIDAEPWSDRGEQRTREIDCCGFNKSIVLVFGIWDIINYLDTQENKELLIHSFLRTSLDFWETVLEKQLKNIAR